MNTDNIINTVRTRFDHASAKKILKEKYQAKMIFAHAGGMFRADQNLVTLLQAIPTEEAVILDLYDNPIKVNVIDFAQQVSERWQEQMNAWHTEYEELSKKR